MVNMNKSNKMRSVRKPWKLYMAISFAGLVFVLLMLLGSNKAVHLIKEHSTVFNALSNIESEVNDAHIWYSAIFSDVNSSQIKRAEKHINKALIYVGTLTKQDTINGVVFYPFSEKSLISNINNLSIQLKNIKKIGEKYFREKQKAGKAEGMPPEITSLINKVSKSVDNLTALVRTKTRNELNKFEITRNVIIILFIIFQILLLLSVYIYNKHRKEDYVLINEGYKKLQEINVNLKIAEQQVRGSETQYRTLVNKAPIGIHELDSEGNFISLNDACIRARNFSNTDEMISSSYFDFVNKGDKERVKSLFYDAINGKSSEFEYKLKNGKEETQIIMASFIPLIEENGTISKVMGVTQNITERRTNQVKLAKANLLYSILSEINKAIVRINNTQELYDNICKIFVELGKFKIAWIGLFNYPDNKFEPVSFYGNAEKYFNKLNFVLDELTGNSLKIANDVMANNIVILNNLRNKQDETIWRESSIESGFGSGAVVPFTMYNKVIGSLSVSSAEVNYFGEEEESLLKEIGFDISFAIEKIDSERKHKLTEKEKRQSEIRYQNLYQQSNDAIYLLYNNRFEIINKKFTELFGYTIKEINADKFDFIKLVSPKSIKIIEERIRLSLAGKKLSPVYEFTALTKGGKEIECETSVTTLDYKDGKATQGIIRDITARKQAMKEIKNSEKSYRELFDNSADAIYMQDKDGKFVSVNKGAVDMYGYPHKHFIGKTPEFLSAPGKNDLQAVQEMISKAWEGEPQSFEFWGLRKNGEIFPKEVRLRKGSYFGKEVVIAFARDITEQKRKDEIVKTSEVRYRSLFEFFGDAILLLQNNKLVDCNPKTLSMFKCSRDYIIGKNLVRFSPTYQANGKTSADLADEIFSRLYKGENFDFEWQFEAFDGTSIITDINLSRIKISGEILILAIVRDISERKKAEKELVIAREKAEASDKLKSEFLAQMSHEIRTPINTLLSFTSLIKYELEDQVSSDLKESFAGIGNAGRRIVRTTDLILNMSEIQTNSYDYRPKVIDLKNDILSNLETEFIPIAKKKELTIKFNYNSDSISIYADEYTVTQIFSNLIDNAIKYTKSGEVQVSCSKVNSSVVVDVTDTGIGISKKFLPSLFDAFSQEEQGYTRSFEGNGLGMALVKKYCDMNNADIKVISEKGKGTTFTVTLETPKVT